MTESETATIEMHGWAHGGDAVGRLPDGRACFVAGALPDEVVTVALRTAHKRHVTADLIEVVRPSPHRVAPPCPYYDRCGGCQLQHASPAHQLELKLRVVTEQLQRIGRVVDPPVRGITAPEGGWPGGYRTWARMAVAPDGSLGFRRRRSHEVQPVDRCLLLTDPAQALRDQAGDDWAGADEVTVMAGDHAGLVTVSRDGQTTLAQPPAAVTIRVGDVDLQVSAGTFFQAGPAAAELLQRTVTAAAAVTAGDRVLDLYSGVGLLSVALADGGARVVAVEGNPAATADAAVNVDGFDVEVVTGDVAVVLRRIDPSDADVVVLDPPRTGARAEVCRRIAGLAPRRIVYVACDPAALARDVRTLAEHGYDLTAVEVLDLFGHTAHVEAVAVLDRR